MFEALIESYGETALAIGGGLAIGAAFGVFARLSRFCMRSAVIETGRHGPGERFAVWLLAVAAAVIAVQGAATQGLIAFDAVRPLTGRGSLSGAAIGGLLFGAGMVLARGCVSRHLVLSAGGNLRAVVTGAIFVSVALATMRGPLAGARDAVAGLKTVEGAANLDLLKTLGLGPLAGIAFGGILLAAALAFGWRRGLGAANAVMGLLIGVLVAAGYLFTTGLNGASFDPQPVQGLSFIAPFANALAMMLGQIATKVDFTIALIPGVALGAFVAALAARDLRIEWFASPAAALRYVAGAMLMGFGGVVATGCSLGNGVSGVAVFSTTALVALAGMWLGALATDALVDRVRQPVAPVPAFVPAE